MVDTSIMLTYLTAVGGFAAVSFILAYIAMNLDKKEHGALQIFFAVLSYLFLWVVAGFIRAALDEAGISRVDPLMESVLIVMTWGGVFFIFYLIVYFLWNLVKRMNMKKKAKENDPFAGGEYVRA